MTDANSEESEDGARLPLPKKMVPYVSRIKLKSRDLPDTAELRQAKRDMLQILVEKKINPALAQKAVNDTLDAAADHQLARLRREDLRTVQQYSLKCLDELIVAVERLAEAVSALPPDSKGALNLNLAGSRKEGHFDTEIFFDLIDRLLAQLPELSPQVRASEAFDVIVSEEETLRASWMAMPASTRLNTEQEIEALRSKTSLELLRLLPEILNKFRPPRPMGAPPSLDFRFVRTVDVIWLKLRPLRRGLKARHAEGPFHRFCNAAISGVGNAGGISSNQLSKLKRRRLRKEAPSK
jgi:hypothetical protein